MTDDATVRRWFRSYRAGASYRTIGAEAGVTESTVRRAIAKHAKGLRASGPRARAKPTRAQVVNTRHRIGSMRGTATALDVSLTYVQARLAEAGLVEKHPDQRPRKWTRRQPPETN